MTLLRALQATAGLKIQNRTSMLTMACRVNTHDRLIGMRIYREARRMRIAETSPALIRTMWEDCTHAFAGKRYVEDLTQAVVNVVYDRFAESLVLARVFATMPYGSLPHSQKSAALNLARTTLLEAELTPHTPVNCLLASRGVLDAWNDRRRSQSHVAIPLISEAFVSSIPMMSQQLKDLGLPLTWVQDAGAALVHETIGSEVGMFYVNDVRTAKDDLGRYIIPATAFVEEHQIKTTFAVGGVMFGGSVLVLILFSRDVVTTRTARLFMPVVSFIKGALVSQCSMTRVFRPEHAGGDGIHDKRALR